MDLGQRILRIQAEPLAHSIGDEAIPRATKQGADALLIVTPYYIRPPQRGLVAYYNELGRRSDLPLLMYHIPGRAAVTAELATLERIVEATLLSVKNHVEKSRGAG